MAKESVKSPFLKDLAAKRDIDIGVAVDHKYLDDENYREIISREFNVTIPEYEMQFKHIHPSKNKYNFELADKVVSFAKRNGMKVRGHVLVWGEEVGLPDWFLEEEFNREECVKILREHVQKIMGRYKDDVKVWHVVNEAVRDLHFLDEETKGENKLKDGPWLNRIGPEYIEKAFKIANKTCPGAKLYYNDYCIEEVNEKSDAVYNLLKELLEKGVPIHGIGLQTHLLEEDYPSPGSVKENIKRFQELGLDVDITEMDVRIKKPVTEEKIENQAKIYREIVQAALEMDCGLVNFWGFSDAHSWVPGWFEDYDAPLIFDKNLEPKPAYRELKEVLK